MTLLPMLLAAAESDPEGLVTTKTAVLVFFFGFFVIVLLITLIGRRNRYSDAARIPLDDSRVVTPRGSRTEESDQDEDDA